ncbi:MAG TPA: hypothetical protein DGT23_33595 [Micromonosporaceae bacterium]|nr:hypothetical protein [Micromonosporaceae bacterium]
MTGSSRAKLQAQIETAFRGVPALPAARIVLEQHQHHVDAQQMASAFGGRHWTELSLQELFFHRESIFTLSSAGYLSYLPAYLCGCLHDDTRLVTDISWYTVSGLRTQRAMRTTHQRLELFGKDQRSAVAAVLRHVAESLSDERAEKILAEWPGSSMDSGRM